MMDDDKAAHQANCNEMDEDIVWHLMRIRERFGHGAANARAAAMVQLVQDQVVAPEITML